jgi:hypothetical protein
MVDFTLTTEAGNAYDVTIGVKKPDNEGFCLLSFALRQRFRPGIRLSGYVRHEDVADFAAELANYVNDNGGKDEAG